MKARPLNARIGDETSERVRRSQELAIRELQAVPISAGRLIKDVVLEDGVETPIAHGLGRPATVFISPPRCSDTSGYIREIRSTTHDRSKFVVLIANSWPADATVDLWVF